MVSIPDGLNKKLIAYVKKRGLDNRQTVILQAIDNFLNNKEAV